LGAQQPAFVSFTQPTACASGRKTASDNGAPTPPAARRRLSQAPIWRSWANPSADQVRTASKARRSSAPTARMSGSSSAGAVDAY